MIISVRLGIQKLVVSCGRLAGWLLPHTGTQLKCVGPAGGWGVANMSQARATATATEGCSLLVELISTKDSGFIVIYAHVIYSSLLATFVSSTTPNTDRVVDDTLLILAELNLFIKCMGLYTHPC